MKKFFSPEEMHKKTCQRIEFPFCSDDADGMSAWSMEGAKSNCYDEYGVVKKYHPKIKAVGWVRDLLVVFV